MNIINRFKGLDKIDKITAIFTLIIIILLAIQIYIETINITIFNDRVNDGNDRWHEVETILEEYDNKIKCLETQIENIKLKQGGN